jgi:hypothetical protein
MSAFDDLTLGEVELMTSEALNGVQLSDADPLMLAGAVMWMTERKDKPELTWPDFKAGVRMGDIKAFSSKMQEDAQNQDPT